MKKRLTLVGIVFLILLESAMLLRLANIYRQDRLTPTPDQNDALNACTYILPLHQKNICLTQNKNGLLTDTDHHVWDILNETSTHFMLIHPDGHPMKVRKQDKWLTSEFMTPDERMDTEYQLADYTPESPYIVLNPYNKTPLSALIRFTTPAPTRARITVKGIPPAADLTFDYPENTTEHALPVIGLYPKHKNQIILTIITDHTTHDYPLTISTREASNRRIVYQPLIKQDTQNLFYYTFDGLIYDEYGFIRYNIDTGDMAYLYPGEVITEHRFKGLTRYSLLGRKEQSYPYPKDFTSFTHGIGRMPNGNFLVIGTQTGTTANIEGTEQPTHRDIILEMDYRTGNEVRRWDIAQILNPDRSVIVRSSQKDYGAIDWIHTNSVQFDASDNSIVLSGRHIGMVKFDYQSGRLKWVFGPALGYDKSGRDGTGPALWDKVLTAVDSSGTPLPTAVQQGLTESPHFQWPTTTHDAKVLGNGYFSIFNNDNFAYNKRIIAHQNSTGMLFKIDEQKKTIEQVWSFPTHFYSGPGSNISFLPDNKIAAIYVFEIQDKNSNLQYGRLFRVNRITDQVLFEAVIHGAGWNYRMEPIDITTLVR